MAWLLPFPSFVGPFPRGPETVLPRRAIEASGVVFGTVALILGLLTRILLDVWMETLENLGLFPLITLETFVHWIVINSKFDFVLRL